MLNMRNTIESDNLTDSDNLDKDYLESSKQPKSGKKKKRKNRS